MANLRQRIGAVTAWNDNRIIHSNIKIAKINQFYCQRCKRGHNSLIIYEGETYCPNCFNGNIEELDVYSQDGRLLKKGDNNDGV